VLLSTDYFSRQSGRRAHAFILTNDGTVLVQGRKVNVPGAIEVPEHETVVAIPREMFAELVEQYIR